MPEDIERIIYKLELDGSSYIQGVESLSASTKKLSAEQEKANQALKQAEANLKNQSAYFTQAKKDLDSYTGSNEKYRQQLAKSFSSAQTDNQKLTSVVDTNRKAYEAATKAAQDFANTSARASQVQSSTTGGKIPTGGVTSQITSQIAGVLNVADFAKQSQIIAQTKNEFDDLAVSVTLAEARMKQLNATDEEFKSLAPIVEQGKEALKQYGIATGQTQEKVGRLSREITNGTDALLKMRIAGQENSAEYTDLSNHVVQLTKEYREQRQAIQILSSETRALDFGKAAVGAAISGFQAYTAVSILAGGASEELQRKTEQLFATMQLLATLEQLTQALKKGSIIQTNLQSAAQAVYTAVVGASTGALKAFRIALLGTGIGAAILLIGFLISKYLDYKNALKQAGEQQKLLNEINTEANKESGKQIADLKILAAAAKDTSLSMKDRLDAVKQLQKEFPEYLGNLSKEKILTGDIKTETDALTESIKASARARAVRGKIDAIESEKADLEDAKADIQARIEKQRLETQKADRKDSRDAETRGLDQANALYKKSVLDKQLIDNKAQSDALDKREDFLINYAGLNKLVKVIKEPDKKEPAKKDPKKEIENVYLAEKAKLDERLAELNRKEADNESKIRIEFAARLVKEQLAIEKLLKEKKLTRPQAKLLETETIQVNKVELQKALADFAKKQTDARAKLNDELKALQDKNTLDSLNLIQDDFDRRAALINFNEQRELDAAKENTQKKLEALDFQRLLIGEEAYQSAKNAIILAGNQAALNIEIENAQQRKDLAADTFKSLLDAYDDAIFNADLIRDENEATELKKAKENLISRKITFEQFQKQITDIQKRYDKERLSNDIETEKNQLKALQEKIDATVDKTTKEYADLIALAKKYRKKIAADEKEQAKETDEPKKPKSEHDESVANYAKSIGAVADGVIQFWNTTNEAEAAALDRSISLQEKRVDAAQRIADRGNAQYLKQEQDRLTQLNVQRENAARKQLGIDAALQASQILVGITGAISHIAKGGLGGAETIAEIAIIIGALATGYGIVKSLQGNQPKLKGGTKYLNREGHPSGVDTIPAWLNEGEAVIPTHRNKQYHPTVSAIYDGTVPAEKLNTFVKNYHKIKSVPIPNYNRIKEAAEIHVGQDGRMHLAITDQNKLIQENNDLQRQTLRAMKSMAVSANIDKDGVSIMVNEYISQMKIDSRL